MVHGRRRNVALNGKVLEEVECFKYLGSYVAVDGGIEGEIKFRMNERCVEERKERLIADHLK